MGLFQKDPLVQLLERLTKIAAIRAATAAGNVDEALAAIRDARALVAGPLAGTLERVDAATAASLLGPEKAKVFDELARLEAEARASRGT
jgi:hypothetical protein